MAFTKEQLLQKMEKRSREVDFSSDIPKELKEDPNILAMAIYKGLINPSETQKADPV